MLRNSYILRRLICRLLGGMAFVATFHSCANIGSPDGGPIDETPPRFLSATPPVNSLNVNKQKMTLFFDEFIKIDKANEKVVVSPPQVQQPDVRADGRRINISLLDSLKANTTYTVDFSDAIQDNNEGNPLGNFTYTFSTGSQIDTMEVAGYVVNASDLEPIKGMLVGLHINLTDSAFFKYPFDRVARTDSRGHFIIRGVAPGKYRIFGLMDTDQNFKYSQKTEALAFNTDLVIPSSQSLIKPDTVWQDSLHYDTIVNKAYTHYLPDDVMLRSFSTDLLPQYLSKSERQQPWKFSLLFAAHASELPKLNGINFNARDAFFVEPNVTNDSILYWIKDSLVYKKDTLVLGVTYLYADSLNRMVPKTDTLRLVVKNGVSTGKNTDTPKSLVNLLHKKKHTDEPEKPSVSFLQANLHAPQTMDVFDNVSWQFDEPVLKIDTSCIHLRQKVDSLWKDVTFQFKKDSIVPRKYNLIYDWDFKQEFEVTVDSAAFVGWYGLHTDKMKQSFKVKGEEEYSNIFFNVSGAGSSAYVELLDNKDLPVRKVKVVDGKADFYYLNPGKYCARLVNDNNANGRWDTGEYGRQLQPEEVFYFPQILETRAYSDSEQNWNVKATPLYKQKPDELKKQKPDENKKKKTRERRSTANNNNNITMPRF